MSGTTAGGWRAADARASDWAQSMIAAGAGMAAGPLLIYALAALYLILGGALGPASGAAVLALALAGAAATAWSLAPRPAPVLLALGALALAPLAASAVIDTTIDGQAYHYQAISAVAAGWNPYHDLSGVAAHYPDFPVAVWVLHYGKSSWVLMGAQAAAGLSLEAAKAGGAPLLLGAALMGAGVALRAALPLWAAGLIGAALAANPIALAQLFTRMNDGLLGQSVGLFAVLALIWIVDRRAWAMAGIGLVMAFAMGLKFSAAPHLVAACAIACAAAWAHGGVALALATGLRLMALGLIALLIFGWTPYVQNAVWWGHPFHPLMGENTLDILVDNTPEFVERMGALQAFFFSLFAETYSGFGGEPALKPPFTMSLAELRAAGGPDVRIGGHGPLFSGAAVLAAAVLGLLAAQKRLKGAAAALVGTGAAAFLVAVIFPESWWARYVPQLWLAPLAVGAAGLIAGAGWARGLAAAVLALLIANAALVAGVSTALALKRQAELTAQIERLAADGGALRIHFDLAESRLEMLRAAGLSVEVARAPSATCAGAEEVAAYGPDRRGGQICRAP